MAKQTPPKALFSTALDEIATAWHKNPTAPAGAEPLVRQLLAVEGLAVAEGLIMAPRLSFRVNGENVVLCRLIDLFGIGGVERLLEEKAIEFVLWRPGILRWTEPREGLFPLAALTQTSPAHSDPADMVARPTGTAHCRCGTSVCPGGREVRGRWTLRGNALAPSA